MEREGKGKARGKRRESKEGREVKRIGRGGKVGNEIKLAAFCLVLMMMDLSFFLSFMNIGNIYKYI